MNKFTIRSSYEPAGDQPTAIHQLSKNLENGIKDQVLLGVTGSGKTFTIANVIEKVQKPTLVIAHNKTLAAQLVGELRTFFPHNAVEYFVSYYDYYQPEAYLPSTDVYIEKDLKINEEIDRLRHAATAALLSREDVIIVSSVSCLYGLGSPEFYRAIAFSLTKNQTIARQELLSQLISLQYQRLPDLRKGSFRVNGEIFEIVRPDKEVILRVELEKDHIVQIYEYDSLTGETISGDLETFWLFPAKHFVAPEKILKKSLEKIEKEMKKTAEKFLKENKIIEAQRIRRRTLHDLEMMREIGYCSGIENYSLYLSDRHPGQPPFTLLDYFPQDFLTVIDESHVTVPQIRAMIGGDYSRKKNLIDNGFRLPSAFDNRPLKFNEFEKKIGQTIFMSATPAEYELAKANNPLLLTKEDQKSFSPTSSPPLINNGPACRRGRDQGGFSAIVEQIVRPTGLVDPEVFIRPCHKQIPDVINEIEKILSKKERVLVTVLTKKMAEDLAEFLKEKHLKAEYLHSEVKALERIKILEKLRQGKIEVLIGVNLLREGLDLPEVSLVAILDADKEGFLRSQTSLIQTIGRAARNVQGKVILYADRITGSIQKTIEETDRRRQKQILYNKKHHITPQTIQKNIQSTFLSADTENTSQKISCAILSLEDPKIIRQTIRSKEKEMRALAKELRFEEASFLRDEIHELEKFLKKQH